MISAVRIHSACLRGPTLLYSGKSMGIIVPVWDCFPLACEGPMGRDPAGGTFEDVGFCPVVFAVDVFPE